MSCDEKHNGKCIDVIYGYPGPPPKDWAENEEGMKVFATAEDAKKEGGKIQALRYKTDVWQEADARDHCKSRGGSFDAAKKEEKKNKMPYYMIRAQADEESAEILLYGDIGKGGWFSEGNGAKKFAEDLKALGKVKNLDIRINSGGGSVFEGHAIYNTLRRHSAKKTVYVDGIAASIASEIAMAGDKVVMPKNSIMMIHDPFGMVVGDAEDMRKMADSLDKIKEGMISAYMRKTRMSRENIWNLMSDETWMTADEAVEMGFADETDEPMRMAAHFDLSKFKRVPENLYNRFTMEPEEIGQSRSKGLEIKNETRIQVEGGTTMDKCQVCGTTTVGGLCPACDAKDKERVRAHTILSLGDRFKLRDEAVKFINEGKTVEEFRGFLLDKLGEQVVMIPPLGSGAMGMPKLFKHFGEQMVAVIRAGWEGEGRAVDPRLNILNATGLGTQVPSEGGFLVQTDFSVALLDKMGKAAVLMPKCWHVPIGSGADGVEFPYIDESSRATGSRWGGVQVYRRGEADTVTGKKPKFGMLEIRLEDLMGICYVTNRMMKDAPSTGAWVSRAFEDEMSFKSDDEIINGSGVGMALGLLKNAALVKVAKETGQPANTIVYENLTKMYSRMPARNRMRAEWYYNQEIEPQMFSLGLTLGMGGAPVWLPPGGISGSPYASLFGRPMVAIEQAAALGTLGDIMFADFNEYCWIEKGGLESETSIHVKFVYDEMSLRFILRNNGAPIWKTALTPYKGSNTLSPYVALDTRA